MSKSGNCRVAVVTDSTANIPPELIARHGIHVVPLLVTLDGQTWRDGVDISSADFYQRLRTSSDFPTTSQPSITTFLSLFEQLSERVEGIVVPLISSGLSGTVDSARAAAAELPNVPIEVIDSRSTSVGLAFPVLAAARTASAGGNVAAATDAARQLVDHVHIYFTVDTLEYLHRGGRIGAAARLLGTVLNVKPILQVADGVIKPLTKVRTRRRALDRLVELVGEHVAPGDRVHLAIASMATADECTYLADHLRQTYRPVELIETGFSPVLGAHGGPGMVGVGCYVEAEQFEDEGIVDPN